MVERYSALGLLGCNPAPLKRPGRERIKLKLSQMSRTPYQHQMQLSTGLAAT